MFIKLPDYCNNILQAFRRVVKWLLNHKIFHVYIRVSIDSKATTRELCRVCIDIKATIRELCCVYSTFRVVNECQTSSNEMKRHFHLELIFVRGHSKPLAAYAPDKRGTQGNGSTGWCTNAVLQIYYYANLNQYDLNWMGMRNIMLFHQDNNGANITRKI